MFEWLDRYLAFEGLPPHGYCLLWEPSLVWTHVISDALIAAAYFSIPIVLWRLVKLRQDIAFSWMLGLFAVFIMACGLTHVMRIVTLWVPIYGWEGLVKGITAVASVGTAALLIPLLPKLLAIPSPAQLQAVNAQLLHEAEERRRTEVMLRQSQKMEAVGQLTGGIAHDFNNLLQVIIGGLDRARRRGGGDPVIDRSLGNAMAGAERAAELTEKLLAFARKQPLAAAPCDLNHVIGEIAPLVESTVGSRVILETQLEAEKAGVVIDRNQFENALLNLAINARDAMPDGGKITLSTHPAQIEGNEAIELRVADTGTGMDAETLARAAEPFFSTKPLGQGTGLGLSQVYGFVGQHGGTFTLESGSGTGTVARLLIPVDQGAGQSSRE